MHIKISCLCLALGAAALPVLADSTNATVSVTPPPAAHPGALTKEESQELNKDHAAALKANPDLVAERKEIDDKNTAWLKEVDEAMIKVDPAVAAVIAKRDANKHAKPAAVPKKPKTPKTPAKKPATPADSTTPAPSDTSTNAPTSTPPATN